jgi:Holliday junction DNA helicase RuvA
MISFLKGTLVESLPTQVTVDVRGVGYELLIPLSSYDKLPPAGGELRILTQLVVREDAHTLYGFMTAAERDLFRLLIGTVSGVGPKLALNILSGMNATAFRGAVANSDVKALSQINGVGRKTAERIIVELRDKVGAAGAWEAKNKESMTRSWRSPRSAINRWMPMTRFAVRRLCSAPPPRSNNSSARL